MKWTEEDARLLFSPTPSWPRRSSNWEPAQALIAALDAERERNAKLERVLADIVNFGGEDFGRQPVDNAHHLAFVKDIALAALEVTE